MDWYLIMGLVARINKLIELTDRQEFNRELNDLRVEVKKLIKKGGEVPNRVYKWNQFWDEVEGLR